LASYIIWAPIKGHKNPYNSATFILQKEAPSVNPKRLFSVIFYIKPLIKKCRPAMEST